MQLLNVYYTVELKGTSFTAHYMEHKTFCAVMDIKTRNSVNKLIIKNQLNSKAMIMQLKVLLIKYI